MSPQFPIGRYNRTAIAAMSPLDFALSYYPRVQVVPDKANVAIQKRASYEHRVTVPAGAMLYAISGVCDQAAGFTVNVLDVSGTALAQPAPSFRNLTGNVSTPLQVKDCLGNLHTIKNPLFYLPKARPVIEPGLLRVQILNLSPNVNTVQVALHFVYPPAPGDPRNEWNDLLDAELELARRAVRNADLTAGGAPISTAVQNGGDVMSQPATTLPFSINAAGNTVVVPGAGTYRVAIHQLSLFSDAEQNIQFLDGVSDLQGPLPNYKGGYFLPYQAEEPIWICSPGSSFQIGLTTGNDPVGTVNGFIKFRMLEKWGN
jgi:hypothetical protein